MRSTPRLNEIDREGAMRAFGGDPSYVPALVLTDRATAWFAGMVEDEYAAFRDTCFQTIMV